MGGKGGAGGASSYLKRLEMFFQFSIFFLKSRFETEILKLCEKKVDMLFPSPPLQDKFSQIHKKALDTLVYPRAFE